MLALSSFKKCLPLLLLVSAAVFADPAMIVPHQDPIDIDESLSLSKLLDLTMEKYPDTVWLTSLEAEAAAIRQRSESWTAGASQAGLRFQEATSGTLHYIDAHVWKSAFNFCQTYKKRAYQFSSNYYISY